LFIGLPPRGGPQKLSFLGKLKFKMSSSEEKEDLLK
jgi:hypothetical protein